jgi:hypothetical protein
LAASLCKQKRSYVYVVVVNKPGTFQWISAFARFASKVYARDNSGMKRGIVQRSRDNFGAVWMIAKLFRNGQQFTQGGFDRVVHRDIAPDWLVRFFPLRRASSSLQAVRVIDANRTASIETTRDRSSMAADGCLAMVVIVMVVVMMVMPMVVVVRPCIGDGGQSESGNQRGREHGFQLASHLVVLWTRFVKLAQPAGGYCCSRQSHKQFTCPLASQAA